LRKDLKEITMWFFIGLAVGYSVAILVAPASGEKTRARLMHKVDTNARAKAREIGARAGEIAYEELKNAV
jgi:gas vesicle protein